jgi:hypothetical protein
MFIFTNYQSIVHLSHYQLNLNSLIILSLINIDRSYLIKTGSSVPR